MDQEIRPKRVSILKRSSTFERQQGEEQQHVHIDSNVQIISIAELPEHAQEAEEIHIPKKVMNNNMTEAQLVKMALKQPQIWEEDEQ